MGQRQYLKRQWLKFFQNCWKIQIRDFRTQYCLVKLDRGVPYMSLLRFSKKLTLRLSLVCGTFIGIIFGIKTYGRERKETDWAEEAKLQCKLRDGLNHSKDYFETKSTHQSCLRLGHNGWVFIQPLQSVIRCGPSWERWDLRRDSCLQQRPSLEEANSTPSSRGSKSFLKGRSVWYIIRPFTPFTPWLCNSMHAPEKSMRICTKLVLKCLQK